MKILKISLIIFILFTAKTSFANELYKSTIDWYKVTAIKVVKWSWYKIIAWVSQDWESLDSLVKKYNWVSGVNWAYFCPADYKECNWKNDSSSDRISNWTNYSKWDDTWVDRVIFSFDKFGNPFLFQNAHDYSTWRWDIYLTWKTINLDKKDDIYNGIWNFPLLLKNWENMLDKANTISEKMKAKSIKNFICSSKDGNTVYMGSVENPNIRTLPSILIKLWCYNAINLDAGGSSAMIYNNKYLRWPGRNIMDAFIVVKDEKSEEEIKKEKVKKELLEKIEAQKLEKQRKENILNKYKKKIDLAFEKIIKSFEDKTNEVKLEYLSNLNIKISNLLENPKLSEKNQIILGYLQNLIKNKISILNIQNVTF